MNMEVDPPQPQPQLTQQSEHSHHHERILKVHPLALIGISDHHTRISMGGSNLPPDSPTIGLLYGHSNTNTTTRTNEISIIDAEEVETSANPSTLQESQLTHIRTKIELHQKVFPYHLVVGWYRVRSSSSSGGEASEDVLPTPEDLFIHNGWMRGLTSKSTNNDGSSSPIHPIFALMDATERKPVDSNVNVNVNEKVNAEKSPDAMTPGEEAREKLDREEELPLTLYDTMSNATNDGSNTNANANANAFVNVDFSLETFEPERIAVEHVFHTQPPAMTNNHTMSSTNSNNNDNDNNNDNGSNKAAETKSSQDHDDTKKVSLAAAPMEQSSNQGQALPLLPPLPPPTSAAEAHLQAVITSIDAMNARVAILLDFLHKTRDGVIAPNHSLLRQVMSLMKQLPIMKGSIMKSQLSSGNNGSGSGGRITVQKNTTLEEEFKEEQDDMLVMAYLASLAKTTKAVAGYTDKFRLVIDNSSGSGSGITSGGGVDSDRPRRGGRDNSIGFGYNE